jgi:hypothetical protein
VNQSASQDDELSEVESAQRISREVAIGAVNQAMAEVGPNILDIELKRDVGSEDVAFALVVPTRLAPAYVDSLARHGCQTKAHRLSG